MDLAALHLEARNRRANLAVYWAFRAVIEPVALTYLRGRRIGRRHVPRGGGFILASNHRSFLDPVLLCGLRRRPLRHMAKAEAFGPAWQRRLLLRVGAFPVARRAGDDEAMTTARTLLARGEPVVMFPEGTRVRPGPPGPPRPGVGRLALETGAPVLPVAIIGTEAIRRGWRIRPHRVTIRCGPLLRFDRVDHPTLAQTTAATDAIWGAVLEQWALLGGELPVSASIGKRVVGSPA